MTFAEAQDALRDPDTSEQMLAEIAFLFPLLHEQIKVHPRVYSDLIDWLNQIDRPIASVSPQPQSSQPPPTPVDGQVSDPTWVLREPKKTRRDLKWVLIPGLVLAVLTGSAGAYAIFGDNKPPESEVAEPPSSEPIPAESPGVEETTDQPVLEATPDEPLVTEGLELLEPTPINQVFPDLTLAQCVADVLGKKPTDNVTQDDLNRVHSTDLSYQLANKYYFYDPDGGDQSEEMQPGGEELIAYARNGNVFGCPDPNLKDISGLEYVWGLTSLDLAGSQVTNLAPLAGQNKLVILNLDETKAADIGPLSHLVDLEFLNISNGTFKNLDAINGMKDLQYLHVSNADLEHVNGLTGLTELKTLSLRNSRALDLAPLAGMHNLEELWLAGSGIVDISALRSLVNLESVSFDKTKVTDLSPLSGLTNLKIIYADGTETTDLTPLSNMIHLREISIPPSVDVAPINGLVENGLDVHVRDFSEQLENTDLLD